MCSAVIVCHECDMYDPIEQIHILYVLEKNKVSVAYLLLPHNNSTSGHLHFITVLDIYTF